MNSVRSALLHDIPFAGPGMPFPTGTCIRKGSFRWVKFIALKSRLFVQADKSELTASKCYFILV